MVIDRYIICAGFFLDVGGSGRHLSRFLGVGQSLTQQSSGVLILSQLKNRDFFLGLGLLILRARGGLLVSCFFDSQDWW